MRRSFPEVVLVLLVASLAAGCAYGVSTAVFRPPYPPTAALDVYREKPPDRSYVEIAQLRTYDEGDALGRLVERAKSLGADAIIVLPQRYMGTSYYYGWVTPYYVLEVVAIKYR